MTAPEEKIHPIEGVSLPPAEADFRVIINDKEYSSRREVSIEKQLVFHIKVILYLTQFALLVVGGITTEFTEVVMLISLSVLLMCWYLFDRILSVDDPQKVFFAKGDDGLSSIASFAVTMIERRMNVNRPTIALAWLAPLLPVVFVAMGEYWGSQSGAYPRDVALGIAFLLSVSGIMNALALHWAIARRVNIYDLPIFTTGKGNTASLSVVDASGRRQQLWSSCGQERDE